MTTLFIGLGTMGAPMVRNYIQSFETVLYDPSPATVELARELNTEVIASLTALPSGIDTVLLMLPNSSIVESVLLGPTGLIRSLEPGTLLIDMSSSVPASSRKVGVIAAQNGIEFVDAPVSGGKSKAITGELTFLVGGATSMVERALPHLDPMAGTVLHVGATGSGHAAKALNNLLSAANFAAAAEVLSAATLYGIAPSKMIEVVNASTGRSQATEVKYPQEVLTGRYDSGFAFDLMMKDLGIARELFEDLKVQSPVTKAVYTTVLAAREYLGDGADHTEFARAYETWNDLSFKSD